MIHLNRKTEYALLALAYLVEAGEGRAVSVSKLAEYHHIPQVLLSKVMQRLKHCGFVVATKGRSGGYTLACNPFDVGLIELLTQMDEQVKLVMCETGTQSPCAQFACCTIREPMHRIEDVLMEQLRSMTLAQALGMTQAKATCAA